MRYFSISLLLLLFVLGMVFSCKKWEDPTNTSDPRINNPYCNDPMAVNYNWGFPGTPDNSLCYYPSDIYSGTYLFKDTVYDLSSDLFLYGDSMVIYLNKVSQSGMEIVGLCPSGNKLAIKASSAYLATVDTTVGDSLTLYPGQFFCRNQDTVTGTLVRDKIDSSLIYVLMTVRSDTGATLHRGRAIKQ